MKRPFADFTKFVKKELDTRTFHVHCINMQDDGQIYRKNDEWYIEISRGISEQAKIDALVHELGHLLSLSMHHGKMWGQGYVRAFRLYLKWLRKKKDG